jgi:hypothetical protein
MREIVRFFGGLTDVFLVIENVLFLTPFFFILVREKIYRFGYFKSTKIHLHVKRLLLSICPLPRRVNILL